MEVVKILKRNIRYIDLMTINRFDITQIFSNLQFWVDMYAIDESDMEWKEALRDILFNRFERVCYKIIFV